MTDKIKKTIDIENFKNKVSLAFKKQYNNKELEIDRNGICNLAFAVDSTLEEIQLNLNFDTKNCFLIWLVENTEIKKEYISLEELDKIETWNFYDILTNGLNLLENLENFMVENIDEDDLEKIKKMFSKDEEIENDSESIVSEYINNLYQYKQPLAKEYLELYLENFKKGEEYV